MRPDGAGLENTYLVTSDGIESPNTVPSIQDAARTRLQYWRRLKTSEVAQHRTKVIFTTGMLEKKVKESRFFLNKEITHIHLKTFYHL